MKRRRSLWKAVRIVAVFGLLFQGSAGVLPTSAGPVPPPADDSPEVILYRTTVRWDNARRLQRLQSLGLQVLEYRG